MIIIDENLPDSQRQLLQSWRISFKQVAFIRRTLKHPNFNSKAKRMGNIIRVAHKGLSVWSLHATKKELFLWGNKVTHFDTLC